MDCRSTLFIAFLLKGLQYNVGMYHIEIPKKLWAIKHSCVVIPCSYTYGSPKLSSESILGIWYQGTDEHSLNVFIKSETPENHVSFLGDLGNGNCSIKIHNVLPENSKVYKFRVEMNHFKFSYWSFVQLNVLDDPPRPILVIPDEIIPEATIVTLKCSTTYTCTSDVANLVWSSSEGQLIVIRSYQDEGVWKVESKQVFQVTKNHDGMSFSCHSSFYSGVKSEVIKGNLRINYKPEILQKSQCKRSPSAIYCECVAIAKPPANITWHSTIINVTESSGLSIKSSSDGAKTVSRLEGSIMPAGDVWCTASNKEGSLSQNLPIHEKPQIIQESHCKKNLSAVYCECAAIGNPPANITWHSTDFRIAEMFGYSINSSSHGSKTISRLEGAVIPPGGIWCKASNMEGSATHNLPVHEKPEILQKSQCKKSPSAIYCECVAIAKPPANITWHSTINNVTESSGLSINSSFDGPKTVSRFEGAMIPAGEIWCTASNVEGSVSQNLPIHEKPQIIQESHCKKYFLNAVYCECAAIAYPPANITWHSTDFNVIDTSEYTTNSSFNGSTTMSRLEGAVMPPGGIWCTASNMEGSVSHSLPVYVDWTKPALINGGLLGFLILCIIGAVFAIRKCRSKEKKTKQQNSYVMADTKHDNDVRTEDGMMRYHEQNNTEDVYEAVSFEDAGNIYVNSVCQNENNNENSEVYSIVEKEEREDKSEEEEEEEEGIYINC